MFPASIGLNLMQCVLSGILLLGALNLRAAPGPSAFNVSDFGATGDGFSDDTESFRQAIVAAGHAGRQVSVPVGRYLITSPLILEDVLLMGSQSGGWPADSRPMPTLLVRTSGSAPTIVAKMGAAIHGILIDYDYGADEKQEFGPAIQIEGGGVSIVNTFIHNPTTGIASNPSTNNGRVNLENIFIVNPRKVGVQFEFGLDIITIRNVEVWNYLPEMLRTSTGFRIGHADEIRISNCAVVGAAIGFHFIETKLPDGRLGRVWGGMSNSTVDFSGIGVKIDTANVLRITGGSIWAHHYGIVVDGGVTRRRSRMVCAYWRFSFRLADPSLLSSPPLKRLHEHFII